jgi:hypothetical protein
MAVEAVPVCTGLHEERTSMADNAQALSHTYLLSLVVRSHDNRVWCYMCQRAV